MSNNVTVYVVGWILMAYKMMQKWEIYLKFYSSDPPTRHMDTMDEAAIAIGDNVTCCMQFA